MKLNRALTVVATAALFVFLSPAAHAAGSDPFGGIGNMISSNAQAWGSWLMIIGALGVGGRFMLGSNMAGDSARNFLFGSIFLLLAGAGTTIYSKISAMLNGGL